MRFGLMYSFIVPPGHAMTHLDTFREMDALLPLAETLGFDAFHTTEHHCQDNGWAPSPAAGTRARCRADQAHAPGHERTAATALPATAPGRRRRDARQPVRGTPHTRCLARLRVRGVRRLRGTAHRALRAQRGDARHPRSFLERRCARPRGPLLPGATDARRAAAGAGSVSRCGTASPGRSCSNARQGGDAR